MMQRRACRAAVCAGLALAGAALLMGAGGVSAPQGGSDWPEIFSRLEGEWDGTGTLFGNAAEFTMEWTPVLGGRFYRLRFSNALIGDDGVSPLIDAEAFYRVEGDGGLGGHWFDTRGVIINLTATVDGDRLIAEWVLPEVESGRTTYRVIDENTVEVTDEVRTEDGWNPFGSATHRRRR